MIAFLNEGMAVTGPAFQLFLYLEAGAFYAYFWHIKGQTLGMQVWKIRTINDTGQILTLGRMRCEVFLRHFLDHVPGTWVYMDSI